MRLDREFFGNHVVIVRFFVFLFEFVSLPIAPEPYFFVNAKKNLE